MKSSKIKRLEIDFEFKMENEKMSNLLYETLNLESKYNPNDRVITSLEVHENVLILKIDAMDSISARAAINSYLKWINLSIQLINQIETD
ncbi:MAG: CTAG/PCC1 family protein [Candidatus Heimdallarchaeota archaeon]|nr:CTAG/PCC1 family protein [Candidatus Heimdallarchaeota archaeon]MCK4878777.1 CTAG/PCC1 family protein [Candidatus Heimdallarchaeota archaeon]